MPSISTGLSALQVSQRALDIIGQNIANAGTPGYHRQVPQLGDRWPTQLQNFSIGNGVEIVDIRRLRDAILEIDLLRNTFEAGNTTTQLNLLRQIESLLNPIEGSIHDRLEAFFNDLERLAARPEDLALRRVVLGTAVSLTTELSSVEGSMDRLRAGIETEIPRVVDEINALAERIAALNSNIQRLEARGIAANDLRDQRDQFISELAGLVNVQTVEQEDGVVHVLVGGALIVGGNQTVKLAATIDTTNQAIVTVAGSTQPLAILGGKLSGLLQVRNQHLPDFYGRLNDLARELAWQVDTLHASGLGLNGPLTLAASHRGVSDATIALGSANPAFPLQAGSLFLTVTHLPTNTQVRHELVIDPSNDSLQDLANAINGLANLSATVDSVNGLITIAAASGYGFDFAGRIPPTPDTSTMTGTAQPLLGGVYSGSANDTYTFTVIGSGTVGVTPGLTLRVTNSSGAVIANLNIGQGYESGSTLQAGNGVTVRLSSGTVNDGEAFSAAVLARPDTTGILAALGLNSFFVGTNASNLAVRSDILARPELLAGSRSGYPGDASNLQRIAAIRDQPLLAGGTQTFRQFHADMIGDIGVRVQALSRQQSHLDALRQQLQAQQQSISGVDINEELARMLQFQRMFQTAARYIGVVNDTLRDLFDIL